MPPIYRHATLNYVKQRPNPFRLPVWNLIVDFTREINNYPDITFLEELTHSYTRSVYIYRRVFEKMKAAGIQQVIIGSHMRPEMCAKRVRQNSRREYPKWYVSLYLFG